MQQEASPHMMHWHPGDDGDAYRSLARRWAGTVTVVTMKHLDAEGDAEYDGVTATAFLTVSMVPPIILVSVSARTHAAERILQSDGFVVNLLGREQEALSAVFAQPRAERAKMPWVTSASRRDLRGVPVLDGTVGAFAATVRETVPAGDHILVLGDVKEIWLGPAEQPLIYRDRSYMRLQSSTT